MKLFKPFVLSLESWVRRIVRDELSRLPRQVAGQVAAHLEYQAQTRPPTPPTTRLEWNPQTQRYQLLTFDGQWLP